MNIINQILNLLLEQQQVEKTPVKKNKKDTRKRTWVTNKNDSTYQVLAKTATKGFKTGKYTKPTQKQINKAIVDGGGEVEQTDNKEVVELETNTVHYSKLIEDNEEFDKQFKKHFKVQNIKTLNQVVGSKLAAEIEKTFEKDPNFKTQMQGILRYMSIPGKASGVTLAIAKIFNAKAGAGQIDSTIGQLMVNMYLRLPDNISCQLYNKLKSQIQDYPLLDKPDSEQNPNWLTSSFKTALNIKKFVKKTGNQIKFVMWDNAEAFKEKFPEYYDKFYGKGVRTTADMYIQLDDEKGSVIPVSLKKSSKVRLGQLTPQKVIAGNIPDDEPGGAKYIVLQREKIWDNFYKSDGNSLNKHCKMLYEKLKDIEPQDLIEGQRQIKKKDHFSIFSALKRDVNRTVLQRLPNIKTQKDLTGLLKSIKGYRLDGGIPQTTRKFNLSSVKLLQKQGGQKFSKIYDEVIGVGTKSSNAIMQYMFKSENGRAMLKEQFKRILPFVQMFETDLVLADPTYTVTKDVLKPIGIDSIAKLGEKLIFEQQDGTKYLCIQVYNKDNTVKKVKVVDIKPIQIGAGIKNQIAMPLNLNQEFVNLLQDLKKGKLSQSVINKLLSLLQNHPLQF